MKILERLKASVEWLFQVIGSAAYKFWWDDCFSRASSLAYTSLFALVPATALMFGLFTGFNIDRAQIDSQLGTILEQILPPNEDLLLANLKEQVLMYLKEFAENVRALGVVSVPILVFTGIALVNTIESALNVVWRVTSDHSIFSKIITFWALITLGPLLVLVSFYWYTQVTAVTAIDPSAPVGLFPLVDFFVPIAVIWLALLALYYRLPTARVNLRDAMLGAFVGAVLFEFTKRGFAYYVAASTMYKTFYGVLVTIPLFLFWLYIVWVVVLFGAEIAYQAGSIKILSGLKKYASDLGEVGALVGLRILYVIGKKFEAGEPPPSESEISLQTGSDPVLVRACLGILAEANLISVSDPVTHSRSLTLSPSKITVGEIARAFRSKQYRSKHFLPGAERAKEHESLREMLFLEAIRTTSNALPAERAISSWTLKEIVDSGYGENGAEPGAPKAQVISEKVPLV